jgi:phosphate starvation-inducible protein PhoH and related proteins
MSKPKRNKRQHLQTALNDLEDLRADEMREMMKLNYRIRCKFKSKKQKDLDKTIRENRITFVTGSPGSGKTFIALKTGLELLKLEKSDIGGMLLTTPIIEVSPKSIGALPGDLDMKINHYFEHFYDNMNKIVDPKTTLFLKGSGIVKDKIVNFIRGATFGDVDQNGDPVGIFCILDEAQNLTTMELKTYISRLGEGSKMVILGDIEQCDIRLPNGQKNGLEDAVERFIGMDGVGLIEFTEDDIVRDPFLIDIMKRYKNT